MCVEIDPVLRSMYAHIWVCWSVTPLGLVHSRLYSFGSIFELVELHEKWKQTIERKMQHTKTGCWIRLGKKKYFFFSPFFSDSGQVKKTKETLRGLEQLRAISLRLLPFLCFSFRAHEYLEGGEKKKKKYMRRERNISGTKRGRERARTHTRRVLLKMTLTARRDDTRNVRRGHQPSPPPPHLIISKEKFVFHSLPFVGYLCKDRCVVCVAFDQNAATRLTFLGICLCHCEKWYRLYDPMSFEVFSHWVCYGIRKRGGKRECRMIWGVTSFGSIRS